jgi:hypothetical protein
MNSQPSSSFSSDGFNAVTKRLKSKALAQSAFSLRVYQNTQIDKLIANKSHILKQIELPALMATKFLPTINNLSSPKVKKVHTLLRTGRWLLKLQTAISLANRYGAAYIVLQTTGETDLSLPLRLAPIESSFIVTQEEMQEDRTNELFVNYCDPAYYRLTGVGRLDSLNQMIIHNSRVLALYGKKRSGRDLIIHHYRHMPNWLGSYALYEYYQLALEASLAMLKDSSVGIYKLKDMAKALKNAKTQDCSTKLEDDLYKRISSLMDGMSITSKVVVDMDEEDFSFVERNYANVEKIVEVFRNAFADVCVLPKSFLFSTNNNSSDSRADREAMAATINQYQSHYLTPIYDTLVACALGSYDFDFEIEYPSTIELTEAEKAELFYSVAKSHTALVASKIITPRTAARRYSTQMIDASLNLTEEEINKAPDEMMEDNNPASQGAKGLAGGNTNNLNSAGFVEGGSRAEKL